MARRLLNLAVPILAAAAIAAAQPRFIVQDKSGGEGDVGSAAQERYNNQAYPNAVITIAQQQAAFSSFQLLSKLPGGKKTNWQSIGPNIGVVPSSVTYTGATTVTSGRVTALALSPLCLPTDCKLFVAAAGGGVWKADNALDPQLNWAPSGAGITSNAIGTIVFDPTDPAARTLYVGTGESNQSGDSEAGVGLFKSTDFGHTWSPVGTSASVSAGRAISSVAIDPTNASHIYMGTGLAIRGDASVDGAVIPPGPAVGLYESLDGGATWTRVLTFAVSGIQLDPRNPDTVYVSLLSGGGIFRRSKALDGDTVFHQILAVGSGDRTAMSITVKGAKTRVYAGFGGGTNAAQGMLKRNDNADQPAAAVLASWTTLSNSTKGTPGFASYHFCGIGSSSGQCWYDMIVASPPGQPDTLWLGGAMQYGEIFTSKPPSNGRTVQRSVNAGVSFTDMTNDAETPPLGMHPDQHAIAFAPFNPDIAFIGSDGGVVRTSGSFLDASSQCSGRGLTPVDLSDCQMWLSAIPTRIASLNRNLATLQFQSVSVNPLNPFNDLIGGTQDNGTWAFDGKGAGSSFESIGGDGGQSGINVGSPNIRAHTFTGPASDVNFKGDNPLGWDWWADPLFVSGEPAFFYVPFIADPKVAGSWFIGMAHVWRTQDNGGLQSFLDLHCNEFTGDFTVECGDWIPLGIPTLTGTTFGTTRTGSAVAAIQRAPGDNGTLWTATGRGRVFVSKNADLANNAGVTFTRIDTPSTPGRFISGIAVDSGNANHAFVSFSGYNSSTPTTPGHVFDVLFSGSAATWTDISHNLGDMPITGIALDSKTGDLFAATDFGVMILPHGNTAWAPAAGSLPMVAVYGLTIDSAAGVLYAATHGRGIWSLDLSK